MTEPTTPRTDDIEGYLASLLSIATIVQASAADIELSLLGTTSPPPDLSAFTPANAGCIASIYAQVQQIDALILDAAGRLANAASVVPPSLSAGQQTDQQQAA